MVQTEDASTAQKRRPGRPSKNDARFEKKRKISTTISTPITSSVPSSPAPEQQASKLPTKVSSHVPLPTLNQPQPPLLPGGEYQSIAASGVLQTSLDRSRLKWINEGVLERYWIKPESGKAAKNAPPTTLPNGKLNPDLKWQKHKGPCRIRVEPHIFECEIYVEEKAPAVKPQPVRQYAPPHQQQQGWQGGGSAYGQPYRQGQQMYGGQQQQYYQSRTLPPIQQQQHPHHLHGNPNAPSQQNALPPLAQGAAQSPPPRAQQSSPAQTQQDKKASPDPVISMLATRASSDPELKALMKEVATGNASQEQLKVFQGHIDELTKVIADEKKRKDEEGAARSTSVEDSTSVSAQNQREAIQYDGAVDNMAPRHPGAAQQPYQQPQAPAQQQPYAPVYQPQQQQTWQPPPPPPPAAPASLPVILAFTTPGSTEDRFLFPQNSILESLSPQHLLASFIVTRKSSSSTQPTSTSPHQENGDSETNNKDTAEVEYWEPVTLMVEVAYNREHILECVKRWVKPAEEVRKHMEETMERCVRAPEVFLPLRLPVRGSKDAMTSAEEESREASARGTPVRALEERPKKTYYKKALKNEAGKEKKDGASVDVGEKKVEPVSEPANSEQVSAVTEVKGEEGGKAADEDGEKPETTETGRPRRAVRKSVRISEG